ncbi:MAG: hypothetical protein J6U05_01920 [Neisseriaceae bacterium]|nr:hypothetical protein [Neisseriaceae bacterium]
MKITPLGVACVVFRLPEKNPVIASRDEITVWQSYCQLGQLKFFRLPEMVFALSFPYLGDCHALNFV